MLYRKGVKRFFHSKAGGKQKEIAETVWANSNKKDAVIWQRLGERKV